MKIYKIVLFIFLAIALLGVICCYFPENGIQLGSIQLRFPQIEKILTRHSAQAQVPEINNVEQMENLAKKNDLHNQKDSLDFYKKIMSTHISRFYFPHDDMNYFESFFQKASQAKSNGKIVRILHYGDSQIELDRISKELRGFFQKRMGGGGPGLLPIVQAVPTSTVYQSSSDNFTLFMSYGNGSRDSKRMYGLMGKYYRVYGSGSCSVSRTQARKIRLILNDHIGNFHVSLRYKDVVLEKKCDSTTGLKIVEWNLETPISAFSLHFSGTADLHGLMVDNGFGVAVDNIPMRGCSGTIFTQINSDLLRQTYQQTDVGMIILQYGGNTIPGIKSKAGVEHYKKQIGNQIAYLKKLYPDTPILFIGPSDMSTKINGELQSYPYLDDVVEALKAAAIENGAAFWNMYEVMGGNNSMIAWVNNGLAGNDYVHFSPSGADKIANYLLDAFSIIYDFHRANGSINK